MPPLPRPLQERFWPRVDRRGPDDCWEWTGARVGAGYGRIGDGSLRTGDRRTRNAHQVAYELTYGPMPEGLFVLHSCDNPPCCNPAHLSVGTHQENMRQMRERGRGVAPPRHIQAGQRNHAARLNQQQVDEIRARRLAGEKQVVLAQAFGVSQATVSEIVNHKHWVGT